MANSAGHGYFEAKATHGGGSDGIVSNRVKVLDTNDEVEVRVSMFFDGTGNNMYNIDVHKENEKRKAGEEYDSSKAWADRLNVVSNDSFKSEYSNVARLFTNYKKEESTAKIITAEYVEGISTKKHRPDIPLQFSVYEHTFNQFMNENLHEDDFIQYPELYQKIKDRNQLKYLRLNYFHTSHECKPTDEIFDYFNPYKTSVRDTPSREIINDTQYRK